MVGSYAALQAEEGESIASSKSTGYLGKRKFTSGAAVATPKRSLENDIKAVVERTDKKFSTKKSSIGAESRPESVAMKSPERPATTTAPTFEMRPPSPRVRKALQEIPNRGVSSGSAPFASTNRLNYVSREKEDIEPARQAPPSVSASYAPYNPLSSSASRQSKATNARQDMQTLSQQIAQMTPPDPDNDMEGETTLRDDTNSATSYADESTEALSKLLEELRAIQQPRRTGDLPTQSGDSNAKQRKKLRVSSPYFH